MTTQTKPKILGLNQRYESGEILLEPTSKERRIVFGNSSDLVELVGTNIQIAEGKRFIMTEFYYCGSDRKHEPHPMVFGIVKEGKERFSEYKRFIEKHSGGTN